MKIRTIRYKRDLFTESYAVFTAMSAVAVTEQHTPKIGCYTCVTEEVQGQFLYPHGIDLLMYYSRGILPHVGRPVASRSLARTIGPCVEQISARRQSALPAWPSGAENSAREII